ncbi:hypothetical protein CYMTET_33714 [Cymbomonas tetramitiformis]|uniref:EF-hand domain-containing protein n=1 Tax=Cymbomonas tetramitiformis TaxID=36881 RepID=A0AAE0FCM1_9CHLO|nr:hypothetical protein CYMTET_33714 [Cymbomonas tetramitiformis]
MASVEIQSPRTDPLDRDGEQTGRSSVSSWDKELRNVPEKVVKGVTFSYANPVAGQFATDDNSEFPKVLEPKDNLQGVAQSWEEAECFSKIVSPEMPAPPAQSEHSSAEDFDIENTDCFLAASIANFFRAADRNGDGVLEVSEIAMALAVYDIQSFASCPEGVPTSDEMEGCDSNASQNDRVAENFSSLSRIPTMFEFRPTAERFGLDKAVMLALQHLDDTPDFEDASIEDEVYQIKRLFSKAVPLGKASSPKAMATFIKSQVHNDESTLKSLAAKFDTIAASHDNSLTFTFDWRLFAWPLYYFVLANLAAASLLVATAEISADSPYYQYSHCDEIQGDPHIYNVFRDGNRNACLIMLFVVLPLHAAPLVFFACELMCPDCIPQRWHHFNWLIEELYNSTYGSMKKLGTVFWFTSVFIPITHCIQLFFDSTVVTNDFKSMMAVTITYYLVAIIMLVSGILQAKSLTSGGRLAYARERYYLSVDCPIIVPYTTEVNNGADVYKRFQQNIEAKAQSKRINPDEIFESWVRLRAVWRLIGNAWLFATNLEPSKKNLFFIVPALFYGCMPVRTLGVDEDFCWGHKNYTLDEMNNFFVGIPGGIAIFLFQYELCKISSWYTLRVSMMEMLKDCICHISARNSLEVPGGNGVPFVALLQPGNLWSWLKLRVFVQEYFDAENIARSEVAIAGVLVTEVLAMSLFVYGAAFHLGYQVFYAGFLLFVNTTYVTGVTYCAVQINLKQEEQRTALINESFRLEFVARNSKRSGQHSQVEEKTEELELVLHTVNYLSENDHVMCVLNIPMTPTTFALLRSYIVAGISTAFALLEDWTGLFHLRELGNPAD